MSKKPVIGITSTHVAEERKIELWLEYAEAVAAGGGIPLILPALESFSEYNRYCEVVDGLLISGGQDLLPNTYGEEALDGFKLGWNMTPERDIFEFEIIKKSMEMNLPILGICRGMQSMAVANGGSLYQDIDTCVNRDKRIKHFQECPYWYESHQVEVEKDSILYKVFGEKFLYTNSLHHQSIKTVPEGFKVTARAMDGIIEAIESTEHSFVLGVQWHPERLFHKNPKWIKLFQLFIEQASL